MADDKEHPESKTGGDGSDPAALAFALAGASREEADVFLRKQGRLVELQIEDLKREDSLRHWSLRVHHISDVMKLAFELAIGFILLALAAGIFGMLWSAAHADGLVIEAFSVPPDMTQKGLTGEVVATKLLDRLADLQAVTGSARAASSYANNWGDDIKVQIPDTGISIGELNRYLRGWLGHETHISGAIYRMPTGIAVTARAGGDGSAIFTGSEADLDRLIQQAAEAVYRTTQPYRYAVYLDTHDRHAEAHATYEQLIATGSPVDRAWALAAESNDIPFATGDFAKARQMGLQALAVMPNLYLARDNLEQNEGSQQHDEQDLQAVRDAIEQEQHARDATMDEHYAVVFALQHKEVLDTLLGDFAGATDIDRQIESLPNRLGSVETAYESVIRLCGDLHDGQCLRRVKAALPVVPDTSFDALGRRGSELSADTALLRWKDVVAAEPSLTKALMALGMRGQFFMIRYEQPRMALAYAELGDFAAARREIDSAPLDCVLCLRFRGRIDALQRNWAGANYWFARAVAAAPSVPFGYADWGHMLLERGELDAAIAKFALAKQKGPRFADPLELWGEALIAKSRADLALPKIEEAAKYAPNWGRIHLKWGEALLWSGRKEDARKQFAVASGLDLTSSEKTELARVRNLNG